MPASHLALRAELFPVHFGKDFATERIGVQCSPSQGLLRHGVYSSPRALKVCEIEQPRTLGCRLYLALDSASSVVSLPSPLIRMLAPLLWVGPAQIEESIRIDSQREED